MCLSVHHVRNAARLAAEDEIRTVTDVSTTFVTAGKALRAAA